MVDIVLVYTFPEMPGIKVMGMAMVQIDRIMQEVGSVAASIAVKETKDA